MVCWERITPQLARQLYPANVNILPTGISFQQNIEYAKQSKVLVDFLENVHKGLSFRTFEALAYRKKLITTNPEIMKYDFYHPNNVFVWNGKDFAGLADFLATPYQEIEESIRRKYSFGNWIRYLFDFPPYQPIHLPR